ncbi:MAG: NADP-dependent malic enzyme [Acidilobaceae archaeon]|nr:NADP-dependent malic enzyme [Acidilobaceae archaeon]MCX8165073.1 NADP-dependent malic enzyme [Acidilobaceae archaeon]MDW7974410.1 NADP-dependent malic enzyme [Sulfolobales archaeon]
MHKFYRGKLEVMAKVPVRGMKDFSIWYTPGVAEPSRAIGKDPDLSFEYTYRWNLVAVVSDGTRVLGLGNIGPEGALPVMEGKGLLFKFLGGVDAIALVHRAKSVESFLTLLEWVEPSFGGINLEDIESPKCFTILEEAQKRLKIPIWHDDQQGTAGATLAALINALKITGRNMKSSRIVLFGAGASNIPLYRILRKLGVPAENMVMLDSKGTLHPDREDIDKLFLTHPWKYRIAVETRGGGLKPGAGLGEALKGADVLIAASTPGPGIVKKEWVAQMNKDAVVFAIANPVPEIWPWEAKEAGARIVATGRSDLPNQVNNSLVFPAMFRGLLDVGAKAVVDETIISAAMELAKYAEEKGLREDYIIPTMEEWEVFAREAAAVAVKTMELGLARRNTTFKEEQERALTIISQTREKWRKLWEAGLIQRPPGEA